MRRVLLGLGSASLLTLVLAGSAFAAHCTNESNPEGVGVHGTVLINPYTDATTFLGTNAAGRLTGGFVDVWLDFDQSGTVSAGDVQVEDDVFVVANHSFRSNPAMGEPAILPPVGAGMDPGGDGHGVGTGD